LKYYCNLFFILLWGSLVFCLGTPFFLLFWGNPRLNSLTGRILAWPILTFMGIRMHIQGLENLRVKRPCIYVSNHQSALEVVLFGHFIPEGTVIIGKKQIQWVPFFGLFFVAAGNILIDRKKARGGLSILAQVAQETKERNASVLIFPEGTRNHQGGTLLPFKRGPFQMAIAAQVPVVPIVFSPLQTIWNAERHNSRSGTVQVSILPPIETSGMTKDAIDALSEATRARMQQELSTFSVK